MKNLDPTDSGPSPPKWDPESFHTHILSEEAGHGRKSLDNSMTLEELGSIGLTKTRIENELKGNVGLKLDEKRDQWERAETVGDLMHVLHEVSDTPMFNAKESVHMGELTEHPAVLEENGQTATTDEDVKLCKSSSFECPMRSDIKATDAKQELKTRFKNLKQKIETRRGVEEKDMSFKYRDVTPRFFSLGFVHMLMFLLMCTSTLFMLSCVKLSLFFIARR